MPAPPHASTNWLIWISLLFLFYLITSFLNHISWLFGAWGNGPSSIWKENQQNFEKREDFVFRRITHIISMGESIIKGKKIGKESRLQKEGMKRFSSGRFEDYKAHKRIVWKRKKKGFWGFLGVKNRGNGERAIATKAIQVCFSLLLEFLPMFDFSACLFFNIPCIVDFGVDAKRPQFDLLRLICLHICAVLIFLFFLCLWFYLKTIWI